MGGSGPLHFTPSCAIALRELSLSHPEVIPMAGRRCKVIDIREVLRRPAWANPSAASPGSWT